LLTLDPKREGLAACFPGEHAGEMNRMKRRAALAAGALALVLALGTSIASAEGTVRINQHDGSVQTYGNSVIRLAGDTVRVFSPDNHDTLIVSHAACSYVGEIQRCLPYRIALRRNHVDHPIGFDHGTVYLNLGSTAESLPRSSAQIPPNGIVVFLRTARGTSIAVHGTIDKVTP
jgi:hypothetical protein